MAHRLIRDLVFAAPAKAPAFAGKARPRGRKALGLRFERDLAKLLPGARHGQWFTFRDANGEGYCQPDLFIVQPQVVYILECKLKETLAARSQIEDLYKPVLEYIYKRPAKGIVVARYLTSDTNRDLVVDSLSSAMLMALRTIPTLHWIGRGPLAL